MPRLPQLRLNKRMQLMLADPNMLSRMDASVEHAQATSTVPRFATNDPRPNALSLAETVELLVRGGRAGANLHRRQQQSTLR
jgi:hypothetical protein